jgi:protein SCO1/2
VTAHPARRRSRTTLSAASIAALLAIAGLLAGCGGASDGTAAGGTTATTHHAGTSTDFEGGLVTPRRQAPPLTLDNVYGTSVDIRDLRGHPVLVTFVYATCPDVCPLIMSNLRQVRQDAGPLGRRLRVIAVSVDPKGDTPPVVRTFLRTRGVEGFVDYLIGSRAQLEPVWKAWAVAEQVDKDNPELIEHSALIYGVTASGELATAYPVGFTPEQIARDLPLLAES